MSGVSGRRDPASRLASGVGRRSPVGGGPGAFRVRRDGGGDKAEQAAITGGTSGIILASNTGGTDWDVVYQWGDDVWDLVGWFPGLAVTAAGVYAASATLSASSIASGSGLQVSLAYGSMPFTAFTHTPPMSLTPGAVAGAVTVSCAMAGVLCDSDSNISVIRESRNLSTGATTNLSTAACQLTVVRLSD